MSGDIAVNAVLAAAVVWRDRSLIHDQAVFSDDEIWNMDTLRSLWVALTASPGKQDQARGFGKHLADQLSDVPSEVPQLCAELLWVLLLSPVPSNISAVRKIEIIKEVYDWSGGELAVTHPLLKETMTLGVGDPGLSFSARRCDELMYLIKAVVAIKKIPADKRKLLLADAWEMGHVLDGVAGSSLPQMSHMLRYLLFPDRYQPIFARRDKRRIIESFSGIPRKETGRWSATQMDEELYRAREQLCSLYETDTFSFFEEPVVSTWRSTRSRGGAPSTERRYWVEKTDANRAGGDHGVGAALWSARYREDDEDTSGLMRELEEGDVIFHFTDNAGISGVSLVKGDVDEQFTCPSGTQWAGEPGCRVGLDSFTELAPILERRAFLSERRYQDELRQLAEHHRRLFFNHRLTLNQGAYLSEAPEALVGIFDDAYLRKFKKHLPFVELPEQRDLPRPQRQNRPQRSEYGLNQLLVGAAGTGKTYTAMARAVEICDGHAPADHDDLTTRYNELQAADRIRLIAFHGSYTYSDFVEAPGAAVEMENPERTEAAVVRTGAFKMMADLARSADIHKKDPQPSDEDQTVWKLSLGEEALDAHRDMIGSKFISLPYPCELNFANAKSREGIFEQLCQVEPQVKVGDEVVSAIQQLTNQMKVGDLVVLTDGDLAYRAIGRVRSDYRHVLRVEDRTYHQVRAVDWLISYDSNQPWHRLSRKKFSSRILYQLDHSMMRQNELSGLLSDTDQEYPENYVLIIDEMGRGDVAGIFGELISLIDPDKRSGAANAMSARLPHSGEPFEVPGNLYLIGTLSASQAGSGLFDAGLYRRFEVEELLPDASLLRGDDQLGTVPDGNGGRVDLRALMDTINRRIEFMADRNQTLGHAFFMNVRTYKDLLRALHHQIIPQLKIVFEEDWRCIQLVFQDVLKDGRPNHPQIIGHEKLSAASVLGAGCEGFDDEIRYWVTPVGELSADALRKVYG